jgi:hypothetical protein
MLRVAFHATSRNNLQLVISGLAVLCERMQVAGDRAFTMYNATPEHFGKETSFSVDMVEIHDDEDVVFCSTQDQVWQRSAYSSQDPRATACSHRVPRG